MTVVLSAALYEATETKAVKGDVQIYHKNSQSTAKKARKVAL
jgi:hypothetical protein